MVPGPAQLSRHNLKSAEDYPDEITAAINKELQNGHTAGPFEYPPWKEFHCSPIGSRIKDNGSHRLIIDLSQPVNDSINEGITKEDFSVQYSGFDAATDMVHKLGRNCHMAKMDIKNAFRLLPIRPSQWPPSWKGLYFVEIRLPFGLRSSPGIFNRFADAVCWI